MAQGMPIKTFDIVVVVFVIVGIVRGRKLGMSQDLLNLLMWVGIVIGGAFAYGPGGAFLAKNANISQLWSNVGVYLGVAVACFVLQGIVKDLIKDKLANSDLFGRLEYPLGMMSGAIRYPAMLIMLMALLHSRLVTSADMAATAKSQKENYGSISLPTRGDIQQAIFYESMSGRFIREKAPWLLIVNSSATVTNLRQKDSPSRQREKAVEKLTK
jgi:uncharacterized membrane protein required for colicin V production